MSDTYPEPADGTIVGWGTPIRGAMVRLDSYAEPDGSDQRWFHVDDNGVVDALDWPAVCVEMASLGVPYRLAREPLTPAPRIVVVVPDPPSRIVVIRHPGDETDHV